MSSDFYPPSRPRAVEGGIKARSARGAIAQTWWSQRFIAVLEAAVVGGRLQRGRTYARKGQVISLQVEPGTASAEVQGSRARPYRVRVGVTPFDRAEWAAVERAMAQDAWYLARLLAGEMPEDIEEVFAGVGLSLFPATSRDLAMDCSCPDWSVPCKHLAATLYLLAESFDEDPFRILAWRGRTREELLDNIGTVSGARAAADVQENPDVPLEELLDTFYRLQGELPGPAPAAVASLLTQVPEVALMVRGQPLVEVLAPVYRASAEPEES